MKGGPSDAGPGREKRRTHRDATRRAALPTSGTVEGRITIVQEDRFRLEDAEGRGYLLILDRRSGVTMQDLNNWRDGSCPVIAEFEGAPDLGAVARPALRDPR